MSSSTPEVADPFGSAPFDPERLKKHRARMQKNEIRRHDLSEYNVKGTATSNMNPGKFDFWV